MGLRTSQDHRRAFIWVCSVFCAALEKKARTLLQLLSPVLLLPRQLLMPMHLQLVVLPVLLLLPQQLPRQLLLLLKLSLLVQEVERENQILLR